MNKPKTKEPSVFKAKWPDGLKQEQAYRILCDDDGKRDDAFLEVYVADDGDVYLTMHDWG